MITFPIVDCHVHFWDMNRLTYRWLDDAPKINRPFLPKDYKEACGDVEVERIVFLQAEVDPAQFMGEADWVTSLAKEDPRIEGMVPWAPLENGDAARGDLETLAQNRLVKGVRRIIQFEQDIGFCLRPDFVKGVQAVEDFGLSFDICILHPQLANTIEMVRQCPNVRFMLDHIAKPGIKDGLVEPWNQELKTLSEMENVWCKISGVATEADHDNWTRDDLRPYIEHVVDCFGFDRVAFGSDWPVATLAITYPTWVETICWALEGCSEEELRKLFHDNAMAFYRLG